MHVEVSQGCCVKYGGGGRVCYQITAQRDQGARVASNTHSPTLSAGQTLPQQQSLERVWQSAVMFIDSKLASLLVHFMP